MPFSCATLAKHHIIFYGLVLWLESEVLCLSAYLFVCLLESCTTTAVSDYFSILPLTGVLGGSLGICGKFVDQKWLATYCVDSSSFSERLPKITSAGVARTELFLRTPNKKSPSIASKKQGLLLKERICSQREQILSFKSSLYFGSGKFCLLRAAHMVKK